MSQYPQLPPVDCKFWPVGPRILVSESIIEEGEETLEKIIVPKQVLAMERAKKAGPFLTAVVEAVGPDCKQIKVGDMVIINRHQVHPLPIEGRNLFFIPEEVVIAIKDPKR